MKNKLKQILLLVLTLGLVAGLFGCGSSSNDSPPLPASYEVRLTNLTANQPFSPVAAILHGQGYSAWQFGAAVTTALEQLAESGSPTALLAEATASGLVRESMAGSGVVLPGASSALTLTGIAAGSRITLATMLVNTNDAFTGIADQSLSGLQVGQALRLDLDAYDAGSEANSETAASVPGPAAGGEGFNPVRDDGDLVRVHPGIVSADDGLATSVLDQSHRIQNPVARLVITRLE